MITLHPNGIWMSCPICKGDGNFNKFDNPPGIHLNGKCVTCMGEGVIFCTPLRRKENSDVRKVGYSS